MLLLLLLLLLLLGMYLASHGLRALPLELQLSQILRDLWILSSAALLAAAAVLLHCAGAGAAVGPIV
jgi:hypothetical protein